MSFQLDMFGGHQPQRESSASRVSPGGARGQPPLPLSPSGAELEAPSSGVPDRNGSAGDRKIDDERLGASTPPRPECRHCRSLDTSVLRVAGGPAPNELATTYLCGSCDGVFTNVRVRTDVCAHGVVLFVPCASCPRTWEDVFSGPHFRPEFSGTHPDCQEFQVGKPSGDCVSDGHYSFRRCVHALVRGEEAKP